MITQYIELSINEASMIPGSVSTVNEKSLGSCYL